MSSTPFIGVWEILPNEKLKIINQKNLENSLKILENEDLEKVINYKNSKGEEFQNQIKDIVFHYLNHSTYHRAQITTELKNADLEAINSDFISYKR